LGAALRGRPRALFFDIDDTFTTGGYMTAEAFSALWRAHDAGIACVPVTGRPAGWCDHIARMWPVAGVVGENGGCAFFRQSGKLQRIDVFSVRKRAANRRRLSRLGARILREVPGTALASDQAYRDYDLAIDYCEDVKPLGAKAVATIVRLFEAAGATAKVSSIHVNGWFGDYSKVEMSQRFAREILGLTSFEDCVFVGDSPNDQPMFAAFAVSVGVANVRRFWGDLAHKPRFVTRGHSGRGFAELVGALV
jgi:HAD superfamily hydrolase (TIGR01484 family)